MASVDADIDELYRGSLEAFVRARTALARTLSGDQARRVRALQKPAAVAWAVNQVFWHAKPVYDRLLKSGGALRSAQISALGGRTADLRGAGDAHRKAISAAVREALRMASGAGVNPNHDVLTRTFEALSLATRQDDPPGRLTKAVEPAGFEALAGITVKEPPPGPTGPSPSPGKTGVSKHSGDDDRARRKEREAREAREEEARQRQAEIKKAQGAVAKAQEEEAAARAEWQRRRRDLDAAEQTLARLEKP
jgi:hypothetical protein